MKDDGQSAHASIGRKNARAAALFGERRFRELAELFYAPDALVIAPGRKMVRSRAAIAALFEGFAARLAALEVSPIEIVAADHDDMAYEVGNSTFRSREDGAPVAAHYVAVWRQIGGEWFCVLDSFEFGHLA